MAALISSEQALSRCTNSVPSSIATTNRMGIITIRTFSPIPPTRMVRAITRFLQDLRHESLRVTRRLNELRHFIRSGYIYGVDALHQPYLQLYTVLLQPTIWDLVHILE